MDTQKLTLAQGEGESVWLLGDLLTFKICGEALSVTEVKTFPENGPPPHIHLREDESFWVLEGTVSVLLGEQSIRAEAGAFVHIPKGTLHTYKNIGETTARMIVMLTPGGFEQLWRELGEPALPGSMPPAPDAGIVPKLMALAPKYQLKIPLR